MSIIANTPSKWLRNGALWFGLWTLIGLSFASQFYISTYKAGGSVTWKQALIWSLGDWYVFALLSLPAAWLARRFHFDRGNWLRQLPVHVAGSILFSLFYMVLRAWGAMWQLTPAEGPVTFAAAFKPLLVKTWHFNLLIYWAIVSVRHAFDYYRKYQERELRSVELEKRLAQARLQALQMQLNPHFLFNALHSISALMHKDVDGADRMLTRLADLLRRALDSSDEQVVTLERELDFLRQYLEIEKTRFGSRLTVEFDTPSNTLGARVPNLILQPLVENAIKHGIEPRARPGRILVRSQENGETLTLEVRDNGAGMPGAPSYGVGLSNTRARLRQLYGEDHEFDLRNHPEGGLQARLVIPLNLRDDASRPQTGGSISPFRT